MWFSKKLNSEEYEKLAIRITDLETAIEKLHTSFMSLRGLIHRKATGDFELASGSRDPERKDDQFDDGLDAIRKLNK